MKRAIVSYVPVPHQGYIDFFSNVGCSDIFLLGRSLTHHHRSFQKDLRALQPFIVKRMIQSVGLSDSVSVLEIGYLGQLDCFDEIIMPNEDICREFAEKHLLRKKVIFVNTFLRWDSENSKAYKEIKFVKEVELSSEHVKILDSLSEEASKSADQYRQVAGAVFNPETGEVYFTTHNKIVPLIYTYFYEGDPRSQFKKGINIDLSLALHAEQGLITAAAREGVSLDGSHMILTDFPCPVCAKLIADVGIRRIYYLKGYAMLDGESILRDKDVEICKIKTT